MRSNYDFSQSVKNPYGKQLKRQVTIRLDTDSVDYFRRTAAELGMPYQKPDQSLPPRLRGPQASPRVPRPVRDRKMTESY